MTSSTVAWWRRLVAPRQSPRELQHTLLEHILTLLESARTDVAAGWMQGGWWTTPPRRATASATGHDGPAVGSCLVGALIRSGARHGPDAQVGRAIDTVYEAFWEPRGQPAAPGPVLASSPQMRLAKVQTLTRWNDAPGRTRDEVLGLLDRSIAQVIQSLAALPGPREAVAPVQASRPPAEVAARS